MKNKKYVLLLVFVIACGLLLVSSNRTFTAYESKVQDDILLNVANWKILVNGQDIAKQEKEIQLTDIVWSSEHTRENKVAPGSTGVVQVSIDPTTTDVAFQYKITYEDHTTNPDLLLTVTSMTLDGEEILSSDYTYTGIVSLEDIQNGKTLLLVIEVEWVNEEENNEVDSLIGFNEVEAEYLKLQLEAIQYKGE